MATAGSRAIRVALVDDDPDTRLLVRLATDLDDRYDLVGAYEALPEAVDGLLQCPVDVVIVGRLGSVQSYEQLAQLRGAVGRARIVVIDHDDAPLSADLVAAAGADALLDRTALGKITDALKLAASHLESAA